MSRSRITFLAAAAAAAASALAACGDPIAPPVVSVEPPAFAKQSTTSNRLLFYDFSNIWSVNADGSDARTLALPGDVAFDPSWAPDGKRVLFNAYRGEAGASIYIANADGSGLTRITRPPAGHIDIRPVAFGKQVAFVRSGPFYPDGAIFRVNLDGTGETKMADGLEPSASADGVLLAYQAGGDIFEFNTVTGATRNLTRTPALFEGDPSYSPNGKQIAFASGDATSSQLNVMTADGTAITRVVTYNGAGVGTPKWSPDGKRIAFTLAAGTAWDIWVINVDGSGAAPLYGTGATEILTAWAR